ncbi:MAG: urease accessory protein UreD [Bacillota bacterium]|nr:urease accessory protein UreD [Bacillota bacterium]
MNQYVKASVLKLGVKQKNGKTVLTDTYFTPPLKILKPFYNEDNSMMKLCLMNVSAGVLEGDSYNIYVNLGEHTSLELYSQSYTKIFKMNGGTASQTMNIDMQQCSTLAYMPHPIMPFGNSSFSGETNINLKKDCKLFYREIISCGRYKRDEVFDFVSFKARTKICCEGKLLFMDNTVLEPEEQDIQGMGLYENYTHQANFIIYNEKVNEELKNNLAEFLNSYKNIEFGASVSFEGGIVIRILGKSSESLRNITDEIYKYTNNII